ncbi:PREDICTED: uncharacterized protein LOC104748467 [Camelina sativa]|uniref:Uncharacterized protein LOC104748467 n=1 Tax=Camelina sativa TaxID=90675 RepID=A0ABM0WB32_CAMSA|nr:PREDICTED: uncharacterized protein LOC104748467 [Camelina sativa]
MQLLNQSHYLHHPRTRLVLLLIIPDTRESDPKRIKGMGLLDKAFQNEAREQCDGEVARMFYKAECIKEVGHENVVQVVTDNTSNCVKAGSLISANFPTIFWTPCVVHTLNLALKNICSPSMATRNNEDVYEACSWIKSISEDVTWIKNFIMNHGMRLVLVTEQCDLKLLTIASNRFASTVVMLKRFKKIKTGLQQIVISPKWDDYKEDGVGRASAVKQKILNEIFWDGIEYALSFTLPIYSVIRAADTDKPSLHLVYEWWDSMIQDVKKAILKKERKQFDGDSVFWNAIRSILTSRWSKSNTPLHCMAHSLNPRFILEPLRWWAVHGSSAPTLQALAFKLLGQPSSSSCCERNSSTYKFIHSATRNKIVPQRAEDLVFVHTNLRLLSRKKSAYKEGPNHMWDVGGDQFDSLDEINLERLEFADLSLDEPELEEVVFGRVDEDKNDEDGLDQ